MATYYQGNSDNIQGADGLQTLVLMNPSYVQYSDTPKPPTIPNRVILNSAATSLTQQNIPQQLVGIPLQAAGHNSHPMHGQHDMQQPLHGFPQRVQYNLWNSMDPNTAARETPRAQQGLSLSLSSQHGNSSMQSHVMLGSKYLKAAQEVLKEVVDVGEFSKKGDNEGKGIIGESSVCGSGDIGVKLGTELSAAERQDVQMKKGKLISMLDEVEQRYREYHHRMQIVISTFEQSAGVGSAKTYTALALKTISKQFRCLRDAIMGQIRTANKSLGDEDNPGGKIEGSRLKYVDHQLRQQRALQQLGMIQQNAWRPQRGLPERAVSVLRAWLFEHFLHPYPKDSDKTMLAKQTGLTRGQVSNWFINARVRLWKPMVEEMYQEEVKEHENNGSEEAASKNEEKDIGSASKSCDLQEKNYTSEIQNKIFNSKRNTHTMQHTSAIPTSMDSAAPLGGSVPKPSGFTVIGVSELEGITQGSPKKSLDMLAKPIEVNNPQVSRECYSIMGESPADFTGGFGQYSIGELGRFDSEQFTPGYSGNNFSLSLGLPPSDNLSLSGNHQNFLPNIPLGRRVDIGGSNEFGSTNTSAAAFESIDLQNRKRFAAPLLPDFVA